MLSVQSKKTDKKSFEQTNIKKMVRTEIELGSDNALHASEQQSQTLARVYGEMILNAAWIDTPLGVMLAISDIEGLYMLEFLDRAGLDRAIQLLQRKLKAKIVLESSDHCLNGRSQTVDISSFKSVILESELTSTSKKIAIESESESKSNLKLSPLDSIKIELFEYFNGQRTEFKTPLHIFGTDFRCRVWDALIKIPYGETRSYSDQAKAIEQPSACRAVANANGANRFAIVIPCHRIINRDGKLGGYAWGLERKAWLLEHEACHSFVAL